MGQPGQHGGAVVNKMASRLQQIYRAKQINCEICAYSLFDNLLFSKPRTEPCTLLNAGKSSDVETKENWRKGEQGLYKIRPRSKHWTDETSTNTNDCVIIQNENELNRKIQPQHV